MEIGIKIKQLRLQRGLTQEELADRCELTKGYISQLENDLTSPSIATLIDILNSLGSDLKSFFKEERPEKIVFTDDDYCIKEDESGSLTWLIPNAQKNAMEPVLLTLLPKSRTVKDMPHDGEEFGYVLSGSIVVRLSDDEHICRAGNAFYFTGNKEHYIENRSNKDATLMWVSCPPSF